MKENFGKKNQIKKAKLLVWPLALILFFIGTSVALAETPYIFVDTVALKDSFSNGALVLLTDKENKKDEKKKEGGNQIQNKDGKENADSRATNESSLLLEVGLLSPESALKSSNDDRSKNESSNLKNEENKATSSPRANPQEGATTEAQGTTTKKESQNTNPWVELPPVPLQPLPTTPPSNILPESSPVVTPPLESTHNEPSRSASTSTSTNSASDKKGVQDKKTGATTTATTTLPVGVVGGVPGPLVTGLIDPTFFPKEGIDYGSPYGSLSHFSKSTTLTLNSAALAAAGIGLFLINRRPKRGKRKSTAPGGLPSWSDISMSQAMKSKAHGSE